MYCLSFSMIFAFFATLSASAHSGDLSYREAYHQALNQKKVLWVIVSAERIELPLDPSLENAMRSDVVVRVDPNDLSGDGRTYGTLLQVSEAAARDGVVFLFAFHEPLLDNYKRKTGQLDGLKNRSAGEILSFYKNSVFRLSEDERSMMESANAYRSENGIAPLIVSRKMTQVAREFVQDRQASANPNRVHDNARALLRARGYASEATENCSQGRENGKEAVYGWKTSPVGHAKQLLGRINQNGRWVDSGYRFAGPGMAYGVTNQGFSGSSAIIYLGRTAE